VLQHTSGLIDYEPFVPEDSERQIVDREVLDLMMQQDHTYFPPGSEHRYSNSGYAVLAMVVEEVSGRSFADFLNENIFEPLGMHDTVAHREGVSVIANRAYGYHVGETGAELSDQSPWSAVLGDGGIYTSVLDLAKWDQALYDNPFVRPQLLETAFTPGLEDYGFGWRIDEYHGHRRMHHEGSTIGFRNFMQRFPDERLTVIVLTNRREPAVQSLAEQVADLYLP
jgi:CubicO group peptidase (beta-lactamase class C family)